MRHDDESAWSEARFPPQTRGSNPFRAERWAFGGTMGTVFAAHRASQLHEVFPSALGLFLRADFGKDEAAVLQVQFVAGV